MANWNFRVLNAQNNLVTQIESNFFIYYTATRTQKKSAGEALVRMEYAPIAYSDLLLANGVYLLNPKLPSVIGGEGAGIVEAIGPGVTSVKVGDRVTIPFGTFTWSERVLAPTQGLFVVPPSIDARTASMLNINPTTAVLLLDEFVKLKPKDWIVLNAANSSRAMPDRDRKIARSQHCRHRETVRAYPGNRKAGC
jgi:NADPH:quinone reductase-like Zn-dependent oxidoreductase